jgi:hypothetical protein
MFRAARVRFMRHAHMWTASVRGSKGRHFNCATRIVLIVLRLGALRVVFACGNLRHGFPADRPSRPDAQSCRTNRGHQRYNKLVQTSARRATSATLPPGPNAAVNRSALCSSLQRQVAGLYRPAAVGLVARQRFFAARVQTSLRSYPQGRGRVRAIEVR